MYSPISYAKNLTYPATKSALMSQAQELHASEEFIHELDKLPDQTYISNDELENAYNLYK